MANINEEIPTDSNLLRRIRVPEDSESWREFFNMYKPSVAGLAMKGGLTASEADEVLQETMLAVSRGIGTFEYNRELGTFKGWLFTITRRAMYRQLRKRGRAGGGRTGSGTRSRNGTDGSGVTAAVDERSEVDGLSFDDLDLLPDTAPGLEQHFEKEWKETILAVAMKKVRQQVKPKQFQMFDLYVSQQLPMAKVTRMLNVNAAQVYMAKLRVSAQLRQAIAALEQELI